MKSSRIDVELGSLLYRHLPNLPLAYFEARRVGDSVARGRELESIRSFLTGSALTLVLDVVFSALFVAVLHTRQEEKLSGGAENQALLVESITGAQTLKAGALEPVFARKWN